MEIMVKYHDNDAENGGNNKMEMIIVTIFMEILVVKLVIMVMIMIVIIMVLMVPGTRCGGAVTATSRCRRCRSRARRRT